jgi:ADP-ribosylation factor-binding protein GGA
MQNLQTPDELEEEDREAQAAASLLSCVRNIDLTRLRLTSCTSSKTAQKLQELIRRGTPKDLAAAQELMKIMAGAVRPKPPFNGVSRLPLSEWEN